MQARLLQRTPRSDDGRRGAVLILALIAVVMVSAMSAAFLQLAAARTRSQVASIDRKEAFYLAEAGLAEAYAGLRAGRTGNVGTEANPSGFGGGLFWVEAEDMGNDQLALHSTGMAGRARVALDIVVERDTSTSEALGVYTSGALSLGPGTRIDSYDSSAGPYEEQAGLDVGLGGVPSVGTGSDLDLTGTPNDPALIRGDVSWGPGSSYTSNEDVYVGGNEAAAGAGRSLPAVEFPSLAKDPGVTHSSHFPLVVASGEYALESLVVDRNADVVLEGPMVLLVGDLETKAGAKLVADTSAGTVDVYVEDTLILAKRSVVENTTGDPQRLRIQHAGSVASIAMSGAFFGRLYAPNATVNLQEPLEVFGSLVAAQLSTSSPLTLHFDRAAASSAEQALWPRFLTWRIVEMTENPNGVADPFASLGVVRGALLPPSEAHQDQTLVIDYTDDLGMPRTYNGAESAFDWENVSSVESQSLDGVAVVGTRDTSTPAPVAVSDQAHLDYIATVPTAGDLKTYLVAAAPLSDAVLRSGLLAGILNSGHVRDVIVASSPVSDGILSLVLDGTVALLPPHLTSVLGAQ